MKTKKRPQVTQILESQEREAPPVPSPVDAHGSRLPRKRLTNQKFYDTAFSTNSFMGPFINYVTQFLGFKTPTKNPLSRTSFTLILMPWVYAKLTPSHP